jgi:hypothetical protein
MISRLGKHLIINKFSSELTIDYNYSTVEGVNNVVCLCGENKCKIYLYTGA